VGLGVVSQTPEKVQTPSIGVCGSPAPAAAQGFRSMAASFVIHNASAKAVRIRGLRPTTLDGLASARVTVALGAAADEKLDFAVGATVGVPASDVAKSHPVATDGSTVIPAHSYATVITSMTLSDGHTAGRAADFELATVGPLGTVRTQLIDASVGLGRTGAACTALGAAVAAH
jgi:hypothetical protein